VLFDLDGVLTRTATVHGAAWKKLFDDFLGRWAEHRGEAFLPFDLDSDYRLYVDGRPRYDGVAAFLDARGIDLPRGSPDDSPESEAIDVLGRLKDAYFQEQLAERGAEVFEGAIALVRELRRQHVRTAVVSSSSNCAAVLE